MIDEVVLPSALDREIREFLCVCFPADSGVFSQTRHWHGSAPVFSVICRDGQSGLAGHVGVVVRDIRVGSVGCGIFGIQNMAVAPSHRGTPVGAMLMQTVLNEADRRGIAYGLLFCVPGLEAYYARTGWQRRDVEVRMDDAGQRNILTPGKSICMVHERAGTPFPDGNLHLSGSDW